MCKLSIHRCICGHTEERSYELCLDNHTGDARNCTREIAVYNGEEPRFGEELHINKVVSGFEALRTDDGLRMNIRGEVGEERRNGILKGGEEPGREEVPESGGTSKRDETSKGEGTLRKDGSPRRDEGSTRDEAPTRDGTLKREEFPKKAKTSTRDEAPTSQQASTTDESPKREQSLTSNDVSRKDQPTEPRKGPGIAIKKVDHVCRTCAERGKWWEFLEGRIAYF